MYRPLENLILVTIKFANAVGWGEAGIRGKEWEGRERISKYSERLSVWFVSM